MRKNVLTAILTSFFFVLSFVVFAQTESPENTGGGNQENSGGSPSDPGDGGTPLGGGAPIAGGTFILMGLAAAYGGKKVYDLYKDNQEELES